ncbi:hypothetical protein CEXT_53011 [Caerostris extrusa]|uniref:Uncharacterized protein n=1 Tax=Caerostris extrusa TaxID=172846 RepID=A0AAV4XW91_CAEEX|nr:hypothetical protein CEXT_53011 [Caerostris extrusa]
MHKQFYKTPKDSATGSVLGGRYIVNLNFDLNFDPISLSCIVTSPKPSPRRFLCRLETSLEFSFTRCKGGDKIFSLIETAYILLCLVSNCSCIWIGEEKAFMF